MVDQADTRISWEGFPKWALPTALFPSPKFLLCRNLFYSFLSWKELYEFQVHLMGNKESLGDQGQSHAIILGSIPSFATYQASLHLGFLLCSLGIRTLVS